MRLLILSTLLVILASCGKEENQAPQISINSPLPNSSYIPENDVPIRVEITDDLALNSYSVKLTADADQSVLWEMSANSDLLQGITINEDWFAPGGFDGTVTLAVEADDNDGGFATLSIQFTVAP